MKIVVAANTSFFLKNFLLGTMGRLREQGFEVRAAAPVDAFTAGVEAESFRVIPITQLDRKGSNPLQDMRLVRELRTLYRREKPDLVLHFTIKLNVFGGIAARLSRVPSIPTITGLGWLFTDRSLKARLGAEGYKLLYRAALARCPSIVFLNRDDRAFFLENGLATESRCLIVPGSGVDTQHFSPPEEGGQEPREEGGCVFLLIGRLLWDKGIGEFVAAARTVKETHPEARFRILGPADEENRSAVPISTVRGWEAEGVVSYLGGTDDVRPFIRKSDVIVLPSHREGLPSALLEAMSMARPVVASDVPGCRELVDDGRTGFLFPVRDAAAMADRMRECIRLGVGGRTAMGSEARQKAVNEFDARKAADAYATLVAHALGSRGTQ